VANLAPADAALCNGQIENEDTESADADKHADQLEDGPEHPHGRGHAKHDVRVKCEDEKGDDAA